MKRLVFLVLPILLLGLILPIVSVRADTVFYSHIDPASDTCNGSLWDVFGDTLSASAIGTGNPAWDGKTLTSITVQACDTGNGLQANSQIHVGVIDSSGNLISDFGFILRQDLTHRTDSPSDFSTVTKTGSHVLATGEFVGVWRDISPDGSNVMIMCADPCVGTENSGGSIYDFGATSNGYGLSGELSEGTIQPSGFSNGLNQASFFIVVAMVLLILAVVRGTFKGKPEIADKVVLPAIIGLGVFFLILQAFAALIA